MIALRGIDHVELHVGNALQAAHYYEHALGFRRIAYRGLETGARDRASHVLEQGEIRIVLTGALASDSPIAAHQHRHGDGVRTVALAVDDAERAYAAALANGAVGVCAPAPTEDAHGEVVIAVIAAYGETLHALIQRNGYAGAFLPGYEPVSPTKSDAPAPGLLEVDHVVGNVELGQMERWVAYYERVFGMTELVRFTDGAVATEYSALMSKVVADGSGRIKLPINEPAAGLRRSQVDEYLAYYEGAGVQHLALTTRDIVATVAALRSRGVELLPIPASYYDDVAARVPEVAPQVAALREHGILVDRDEDGYLLQTFTRPLGDRPTLFLELIERHGSRGFGDGNFRALFEAIEREQARRGNL